MTHELQIPIAVLWINVRILWAFQAGPVYLAAIEITAFIQMESIIQRKVQAVDATMRSAWNVHP